MLQLEKGYTERGAQMGRRDELPDDPEAPLKLHLEAIRWQDGDYDQGGAYWGFTPGTNVFVAHLDAPRVRVYVRATSREEAKELVKEALPNARFYR